MLHGFRLEAQMLRRSTRGRAECTAMSAIIMCRGRTSHRMSRKAAMVGSDAVIVVRKTMASSRQRWVARKTDQTSFCDASSRESGAGNICRGRPARAPSTPHAHALDASRTDHRPPRQTACTSAYDAYQYPKNTPQRAKPRQSSTHPNATNVTPWTSQPASAERRPHQHLRAQPDGQKNGHCLSRQPKQALGATIPTKTRMGSNKTTRESQTCR